MRLPDKKRPGNPVLASDWNLLIEAIAARTPRPSPGLELVHSSGGFAYRMRRYVSGNAATPPPFHPSVALDDSAPSPAWKVRLHPGYVVERNPKGGEEQEAVKIWAPQDGNDPPAYLDDDPAPVFTLTSGQTLCCTYETDDHGAVKSDPWPKITVEDDWKGGTHYQPKNPDESTGTEGVYRVPIVKVEGTAAGYTVTVFQQSDIEHTPELWTGQNLGGGAAVFKKRNHAADTYQFRGILGLAPILAAVSGDGNSVEVSIDGGAHLDLTVSTWVSNSIAINYLDHDNTPRSETLSHTRRAENETYRLWWRHGIYMGMAGPFNYYSGNPVPPWGDDDDPAGEDPVATVEVCKMADYS